MIELESHRSPLRTPEVLRAEFEAIFGADKVRDLEAAVQPLADEDARLEQVQIAAAKLGPVALCLSGGGIRSASFALGVLQALAQSNLLTRFHYLSTVSGGGYIGAWLSALLPFAGCSPAGLERLLGRWND